MKALDFLCLAVVPDLLIRFGRSSVDLEIIVALHQEHCKKVNECTNMLQLMELNSNFHHCCKLLNMHLAVYTPTKCIFVWAFLLCSTM